MHRPWPLTIATAGLLGLLLTGCGDDGDDDVAGATTTAPAISTATAPATSATTASDAAGGLPFVDEFDDDRNGWGGSHQRVEGGAYVWDLPSGQGDARAADTLIRIEDDIEHLTATTSFTATGTMQVAIECAYEELDGSSQWYSLELGQEGAVIRRRPLGNAQAQVLASSSEATLVDDRPTELSVTCEPGDDSYLLTLSVDGEEVARATDPEPFGRAGAPNLAVVARPDRPGDETHVVRFDRFEVTP